jgi:hypothetical protein
MADPSADVVPHRLSGDVSIRVIATAGRIPCGPAPVNRAVPPYAFTTDTKIKVV